MCLPKPHEIAAVAVHLGLLAQILQWRPLHRHGLADCPIAGATLQPKNSFSQPGAALQPKDSFSGPVRLVGG